MTTLAPPQDLECPDPAGCTVALQEIRDLVTATALHWARSTAKHHWFRVYGAQGGFAQPNPGFGDTRFAPFDDARGRRVPTIYLAETLEAALLETTLHDVGPSFPRVVSEKVLHGQLHARLVPPRDLRLIDMRDHVLNELGLDRRQFASSTAEHYPCTRRTAQAIHAYHEGRRIPDGIIWHSRQAELTGRPSQEVAVIFADRVPFGRDTWRLAESRTSSGALLEGSGRGQLEALAEKLDVTIVHDAELDS